MNKDITRSINKLSQAVSKEKTGISKEDVFKVIDDKFNDTLKRLDTYRQVEDKPKKVKITDISDNAKKKLQSLYSQDEQSQLTPEQLKELINSGAFGKEEAQGMLSKIGSKLMDWAGNILQQVFKIVGSVVRWTTQTFMKLVTGVSDWLLKKISIAMGIGAVRGAAGGIRSSGKGARIAKLVGTGLGLGAVGYGMNELREGMDTLNEYAITANSSVEQAFPESGGSFENAAQMLNSAFDIKSTDDGGLSISSTPPADTADQTSTDSVDTSTPEVDDTSVAPEKTAMPQPPEDPATPTTTVDEPKAPPMGDQTPASAEQQSPTETAKTPPKLPLPKGMTQEQLEKLLVGASMSDDPNKYFQQFVEQEGIKDYKTGEDKKPDLLLSLGYKDPSNSPMPVEQPDPPAAEPPPETPPVDFTFIDTKGIDKDIDPASNVSQVTDDDTSTRMAKFRKHQQDEMYGKPDPDTGKLLLEPLAEDADIPVLNIPTTPQSTMTPSVVQPESLDPQSNMPAESIKPESKQIVIPVPLTKDQLEQKSPELEQDLKKLNQKTDEMLKSTENSVSQAAQALKNKPPKESVVIPTGQPKDLDLNWINTLPQVRDEAREE